MKQWLYALLLIANSAVAEMVIAEPWAAATPPAATVGGGYMQIRNTGSAADRLIAATSPLSERVEMHASMMENGIAKMRQQPSLTIPAGGQLELKPGGSHLMFVGLKRPFKQGEKVPVTLHFERAGEVRTALSVQRLGAKAHAH